MTTNIPLNLPIFLITPFILLLGMIATGPVLYPRFWHRYYVFIAIVLASIVVGYYVIILQSLSEPIEALADYVQFIALIGALYMTSSGILISINTESTSLSNLVLLWMGAILSNIIGTTGASMLLIRPFIRINKRYVQPYHMVFFIFMVSNVGGGLTPVGDPPLFLGFLKGVPFFWTLWHCFLPWLVALSLLSAIFYCIDQHYQYKRPAVKVQRKAKPRRRVTIKGKRNFIFLLIIGLSVFIDPNILEWVPSLKFHNHAYSFIRELIFISIGIVAYLTADEKILQKNAFSFEPLKEVVCIFFGIFGTMIPVLALINAFAQSKTGQNLINPHTLYWGVGGLSSFLDNAPTYLTALQAGTASQGEATVLNYSQHAIQHLKATSISAVFFGAMTYIGNAPNYMVRKIAEDNGIKMPSFFTYLIRYAIPYLLPVLVIIWLLFFVYS